VPAGGAMIGRDCHRHCFFEKFDASNLALLYQQKTASGEQRLQRFGW